MLICLDSVAGVECGAENRDDAKFCIKCGRPLRQIIQLRNISEAVGRYCVERLLGRGGFGAVYEVVDTRNPRARFALKETLDAQSITSLEKEFDTLRGLQHPNLPRYYETFQAAGNGYLVMELVPGQNLQQILEHQKGPLAETQVLGYAVQLCDVLSYLHAQNPPILHRDIKPANIRLTPEGLIKLVDFGLLKVGAGTTQSSRRGLTPAYAPLEQYGGTAQHTDARSDIYSLGATLYHLLTNQPPSPIAERIAGSADTLVLPQRLNPRISNPVARAIADALAIKRDARYPSAAIFKQALQGIAVQWQQSSSASVQFATRSGKTIPLRDLQSLVDACDENWSDAKTALFNRDLEVWLGILQQADLVNRAAEVRLQYAQAQDRGLELFLEEAEKGNIARVTRPRLRVQPSTAINWSELHQNAAQTFTVENVGKGFFFGAVRVSAPLLELSQAQFEGNKKHSLEVKTDLAKLALDQLQTAILTFDTNGGRLDIAVQLTRVNARVYLARGAANYNQRRLDLALQNYQAVFNRDPNSDERAHAATAIAIIYSNLGRWNECFQWTRQEQPKSEWVGEQKLHWNNARGNLIQFCQAWANELYRQSNQQDVVLLEKARDWYGRAQQLGLNDLAPLAQILIDLALRYSAQANFDAAYQAWQQAQTLAPTLASNARLAQCFVESAQQLADQGRFDLAAQRYAQAQAIAPFVAEEAGLAQIHFQWAQVSYRDDYLDLAVAQGRQAIALDPASPTIAQALTTWQNLVQQTNRVERASALTTYAAGLVGLTAFLSAWLIETLTHWTLVTLIAVAGAALCLAITGLAFVLRRSVKRYFDLNFGGLVFVTGLLVSELLWVIPSVSVNLWVGILCARTMMMSQSIQVYILLAVWLGLETFVLLYSGDGATRSVQIGVGVVVGLLAIFAQASIGGIAGFLAALFVGGVALGVAAFAYRFPGGAGQGPSAWQPLITPPRVMALVALLALVGFFFGWEWLSDRTVEKVRLYEQARVELSAKRIPDARATLRQLLALDPTMSEAQTLFDLAREVDLEASELRVDRSEAQAGNTLTYSIVITNRGADAASNAALTDTLPSQLRLISQSLPTSVRRISSGGSDALTWRGAIGSDQSAQFSFQAQVLPVPMTPPAITNSFELNNGIGAVITRQAIVRLLPTGTPTPTGTATRTPTATRTRPPTAAPTNTPEPPRITNGAANWSSSQGQGGWYYVEGKPGDYANWQDMRFDNRLTYPSCEGGCWRSNIEGEHVRLDKFGGHPGATHYVAKRWVSSVAGQIRVSVVAYMVEPGGNGITVRVIQNGNVIKPPITLDSDQTQDRAARITFDTSITLGGWLMLAVESNGDTNFDHTVFDMSVYQIR